MLDDPHDDNPESARVSAAQQFLFPVSPRAVCDEIGLNWWAALKLHEDGWLSFNPETAKQLDEVKDAELRFVGTLVGAGCDSGLLHHLLDGLSKPYCYRTGRIYYDWSTKHWRLVPKPWPEPEAVVFDWIDDLGAKGDYRRLEKLKLLIEDTIPFARSRQCAATTSII